MGISMRISMTHMGSMVLDFFQLQDWVILVVNADVPAPWSIWERGYDGDTP